MGKPVSEDDAKILSVPVGTNLTKYASKKSPVE